MLRLVEAGGDWWIRRVKGWDLSLKTKVQGNEARWQSEFYLLSGFFFLSGKYILHSQTIILSKCGGAYTISFETLNA